MIFYAFLFGLVVDLKNICIFVETLKQNIMNRDEKFALGFSLFLLIGCITILYCVINETLVPVLN